MVVFDEQVPYLVSKPIPRGDPTCMTGLRRPASARAFFALRARIGSVRYGERGLPLLGSGD